MPEKLIYPLCVLGAYLLGSIPFGLLVARIRGVDIRTVGSGNIGATNAMRVLGKPAGLMVLFLDALKGYLAAAVLPVLLARALSTPMPVLLPLLAGIGAVLGHNYTCWLKFKGGKGIATTGGVYLALVPGAVLAALLAFAILVSITRYVSVGSIAAAVVLPGAVWILKPGDACLDWVTSTLGLLAIYKHKSNIQRLRAGTENRLGQKAEAVK